MLILIVSGCSSLFAGDTSSGPPDRRADVLIPAIFPDVLAGGRAMELDSVFGLGHMYEGEGSAGRIWSGSLNVRLIISRFKNVGDARKNFAGYAPHKVNAEDWGAGVKPTVISPFQVGGSSQGQLESQRGPHAASADEWLYWARYGKYVVFAELRFVGGWYGIEGVTPEQAKLTLGPLDAHIRRQLDAGADLHPDREPPGPTTPAKPTGYDPNRTWWTPDPDCTTPASTPDPRYKAGRERIAPAPPRSTSTQTRRDPTQLDPTRLDPPATPSGSPPLPGPAATASRRCRTRRLPGS
ncbi:hypothetical protein [Streptomyces sp. SID3343]|uniref:hypothetical protein n=1 Tax=Streptomyces sp. SID3343 TaxID=2690260 RepID=UPI00136F1057|nr:hypothetical protein [Streptomyces sp. SID3343]MYW04247.1 hypothetical protein [Streptomyces sp. SID3343]